MHISKLYKEVTDVVIRQLEEGTPPWVRPWTDAKLRGVGMIPSNLVTGRLYSGGNILLLWMAAHQRGYGSLQFCTYKQVNDIGARVRKGERATNIIFTRHLVKKDDDTGEEKGGTLVKSYAVFHTSQLEDVESKYLHPQQAEEGISVPKNAEAVEFYRRTGIVIRHEGNKAFYSPAMDVVVMPPFSAFTDEEAYHGTACHELVHATGHQRRLGRTFGKRFGDEQYAVEELVAELGSAYICARLGYSPSFRSASYLQSWLRVLKADNRAIFSAASFAGQAADWLWKESAERSDHMEAAE